MRVTLIPKPLVSRAAAWVDRKTANWPRLRVVASSFDVLSPAIAAAVVAAGDPRDLVGMALLGAAAKLVTYGVAMNLKSARVEREKGIEIRRLLDQNQRLEEAAAGIDAGDKTTELARPIFDAAHNIIFTHVLGSGGMAMVFLGLDTKRQKNVACKIVLPGILGQEAMARFNIEVDCMVAVSGHPHIVDTYDYFDLNSQLYRDLVGGAFTQKGRIICLVMERIKGVTLEKKLEQQGRLPLSQAVTYATQTARALKAIDEKGIVHRDLKPSNLIIVEVDGEERIKVLDFGIAKSARTESKLTRVGDLVGTPQYMAPEQWLGGEVDSRSDQHALGMILFEMISGEPPFGEGEDGANPAMYGLKVMEEIAPDILTKVPGAPRELAQILNRMLAKTPHERYQTWDEIIAALENVKIKL